MGERGGVASGEATAAKVTVKAETVPSILFLSRPLHLLMRAVAVTKVKVRGCPLHQKRPTKVTHEGRGVPFATLSRGNDGRLLNSALTAPNRNAFG